MQDSSWYVLFHKDCSVHLWKFFALLILQADSDKSYLANNVDRLEPDKLSQSCMHEVQLVVHIDEMSAFIFSPSFLLQFRIFFETTTSYEARSHLHRSIAWNSCTMDSSRPISVIILLHVLLIGHAPRLQHVTSAYTLCLTLRALITFSSFPCETLSPLF